MRWISKEQVLSLHKDIVGEFGGKEGVRDEALLDSALKAPFQTFGGSDLYPGVLDKSARLAYGIIKNHPFYDGNKRMGTHLMLIFQELNGLKVHYRDEELIELIVSVASGKVDEEAMCLWVEAHLK